MPYDQSRFRDLIARAAFDCSFYKGTWQDLSPAQRTMTAVGAPTWGRVNGLPCLKQNAAADRVVSGNLASFLDITGSMSFEVLTRINIGGLHVGFDHLGAGVAGGCQLYWSAGLWTLDLYNLAAAARRLTMPAASHPTGTIKHVLFASVTAGASGLGWVNGVPVAVGAAGAAVPANFAGVRPINAAYAAALAGMDMIIRVYPFALTNEDAACLSEAARLLCGGW